MSERDHLLEHRTNDPFRSRSPSPAAKSHTSSSSPSSSSSSSSKSSGKQSPNPLYILPLNFLNAFGWALIEVPLVYFLRTRLCERHYGDDPGSLTYGDPKCRLGNIQIQVSTVRAGFQTIAAVLGMLTTASYGSLSDRRGRRRTLLTCSVFHALGDVGLFLCVYFAATISPYCVLVSAVFKGCGGYISAVVAGQNSYVADCTNPEDRSRYLGWNFATYHLGTAAGPILSGVLVSRLNQMDLVFVISTSLWVTYFLYTYFVLPESNANCELADIDAERSDRAESVDGKSDEKRSWMGQIYDTTIEPLAIILPSRTKGTSFDVLDGTTEAKRHWDVCIAGVVIGLTLFSTGSMGMLPLYTDYVLHWGPLKASLLMSVDAGASAVSLTFIFPALCWAFGKFLKRFGGASGVWEELPIRIPWLSSEDSGQPPSGFHPPGRRPGRDSHPDASNDLDNVDGDEEANNDEADLVEHRNRSTKITVVKRDLWVARTGYSMATLAA